MSAPDKPKSLKMIQFQMSIETHLERIEKQLKALSPNYAITLICREKNDMNSDIVLTMDKIEEARDLLNRWIEKEKQG